MYFVTTPERDDKTNLAISKLNKGLISIQVSCIEIK